MNNPARESIHYGADDNGLICGFRFAADGAGVPVGTDSTPADAASSGFTWLHFNLSHAGAEKWIAKNLAIAPAFLDAYRDVSRSTRVELTDDLLIAVVNDVLYDFQFEPSEISTLWLVVTPGLVLSARVQPLRSIDRLRDAVRKGAKIKTPVELLVRLMHDQSDVLVGIVRTATHRVDSIEDSLLSGRIAPKRAHLGSLRRVLVRLQRLLAPEPAALFRLLRMPPPWVGADDAADLHHAAEDFNVALRDMATLQERIKLIQEEIAGRVAEANNRSLFTLTVVTVLALPINLIAGLMGMNVGGVPLADHPRGFWVIFAIVFSFTCVAGWVVLRYRDKE